MAGPASLEWLYLLLGVAAAAAGAVLILWALFWDRPRGRKRCPRCWYEVSAVPGPTCPECGHRPRSERATARTRRRWRWAAAGLLLCLAGYVTLCMPRILRAGWPGAVPTTALIWGVGRYEPPEVYRNNAMSPPSAAAQELARRCAASQLWEWQWRMLVRDLRMVSSRERWPRDTPWQIAVAQPSWLSGIGRLKVSVPEDLSFYGWSPPGEPRVLTTEVPPIGLPQTTATLAPGTDRVTVRVSCTNWSGDLVLPVRHVATPEDAMTPVQSPELDAAIRRALHCGISNARNAATRTDKLLGARLYRERGPVPEDLAIALGIDLLRDGTLIACYSLGLHDSAFGEPTDWIRINMPDPAWKEWEPEDMAKWTVRIRGDAEKALGDFKREKYWGGQYTLPLGEFLLD